MLFRRVFGIFLPGKVGRRGRELFRWHLYSPANRMNLRADSGKLRTEFRCLRVIKGFIPGTLDYGARLRSTQHQITGDLAMKNMKKKQSSKKRRKPITGQHRKSTAKNPPIVLTGLDVTEDDSIDQDENTLSGDTQGLSGDQDVTFESVKELTEEGQYLEAEVVDGVENAPLADAGPIKTKEVPEDDVPPEYLDPERE
jgi:hypothetical protein